MHPLQAMRHAPLSRFLALFPAPFVALFLALFLAFPTCVLSQNYPAKPIRMVSAITGGAVTDGSSLFCNSTAGAPYNGIRAGADVNTWQFADGVHPTTGGHKALSDVAVKLLQSYGWF